MRTTRNGTRGTAHSAEGKVKDSEIAELLNVDAGKWRAEIPEIEEFIAGFGKRLPSRMKIQLEKMSKRLGNA